METEHGVMLRFVDDGVLYRVSLDGSLIERRSLCADVWTPCRDRRVVTAALNRLERRRQRQEFAALVEQVEKDHA